MKCYTMRKVLIKSKSIMRRDHEELIPVFFRILKTFLSWEFLMFSEVERIMQ